MNTVLNITTRVVALLFRRGPAAIAGFVVPVHVRKAIDGMGFTWARTHVGVEGGEVIGPPFANRNPPSAIIVEALNVRVAASVFHVNPDVVFIRPSRTFRLAVKRTVLAHLGNVELNFIAPAGGRLPTKQLSSGYGALRAAIALAIPKIAKAFMGFTFLMREGENGPSSEPLAFKAGTVFRFAGHRKPPQQVTEWAVRGLDSFGGSARILT